MTNAESWVWLWLALLVGYVAWYLFRDLFK